MNCLFTSTIAIFALFATPALADSSETSWALGLEDEGKTLSFFFDEVDNAEDLGLALTCAHGEGDDYVGDSVVIIADDMNNEVAKDLVDFNPFGDAAARFVLGGASVAVEIRAFKLEADELNAGWDLTLDLSGRDGNPIRQLGPLPASGPIHLVVVGHTYDLTPRPQDRQMFSDFVSNC
jgi:hypothetical protein